jgi:hypothetical protein
MIVKALNSKGWNAHTGMHETIKATIIPYIRTIYSYININPILFHTKQEGDLISNHIYIVKISSCVCTYTLRRRRLTCKEICLLFWIILNEHQEGKKTNKVEGKHAQILHRLQSWARNQTNTPSEKSY